MMVRKFKKIAAKDTHNSISHSYKLTKHPNAATLIHMLIKHSTRLAFFTTIKLPANTWSNYCI